MDDINYLLRRVEELSVEVKNLGGMISRDVECSKGDIEQFREQSEFILASIQAWRESVLESLGQERVEEYIKEYDKINAFNKIKRTYQMVKNDPDVLANNSFDSTLGYSLRHEDTISQMLESGK